MATQRTVKTAKKSTLAKAAVAKGKGTAKQRKAPTRRQAADRAGEVARKAGATGTGLSGARRALRDSLIIARRAQRVPWAEVAKEAGVSQRQAIRVVKDHAELKSALDETPMTLLENVVRGYERSIADFEGLALAYSEEAPAAALGSKKAADETRARLIDLLGRIGKLPSNLEVFRSEAEMTRIAEAMGDVMLRLRDGKVTADEAFEFFRGLLRRREQAQLPAGGP